MATQNQDRLRTHFASLETTTSAQGSGWDSLWEKASFLPWDRGYANPALIDLLANPSSPPTSPDANPTPGAPGPDAKAGAIELPKPVEGGKRRKVLIPGCGKGYDVALFAAYGYDAYGLEVSQHAAKAAEEYLGNAGSGSLENEYEGKDNGAGKGKAVCLVGDFFEDAWVKETGEGAFDLIYDNTVSGMMIRIMGLIANIYSFSARSRRPSVPSGLGVFPPSSRRTVRLSVSSSRHTNPRLRAARRGRFHLLYTVSCLSGRARRYRMTKGGL